MLCRTLGKRLLPTTSRRAPAAFISSSGGTAAAFTLRSHGSRAMSAREDGVGDEGREGHLERTADEPREADLHEVRLERVEQVNERVRLFRLGLVSGPVKFLPGQWLDTYIPGVPKAGGFTITSAPSSSSPSSPSEPPYFELAVQESPDNEPAAWLWRPVDEILGQKLRVRVGGRFVFPPVPSLAKEEDTSSDAFTGGAGAGEDVSGGLKRVVFVAGGVGVNPLVSMLSHIASNNARPPLVDEISFLYASKLPLSGNLSDILFLERITRLFGEGRVKGGVKLFVTAADELHEEGRRDINGTGVEVHRRRVMVKDVEDAVVGDGDGRDEGTVVYVCGPRGMTDEFVERLKGVIDPRRVLTEKWW